MKSRYLGLAIVGILTMAAGVANAAGTAVVTASVTVQNISVSVSSGTITYGTIAANTSKSTIATDLNNTQTATNNGNVAEDINIRGMDSTAWTLAATPGVEQYSHKFCTASCTTPPTNFTALTTSNTTLVSNLAKDGSQTFDLQLSTPTTTTTFTPQQVDITIQAVAHE